MRVGFVGLGNMGRPMARNLIRSGHRVSVYNRGRNASEAFAAEGATVADSAAEAARSEIVITMLADDNAVESLALGHLGVAEGLPPGGLHVSMSTISPALSRRLAATHAGHGQQYLAAPVFGRPEAAETAKLFIVAAGAEEALAKARPLFGVLGQRTFEVGADPSQANLTKLLGNFLIACVIESLAEVFAVSRKAGLDPGLPFEVFSETLFNAPVYKTYGPLMLEGRYSPAGFKVPLGLKDVKLALEAAEQLSAPLPFANIIRDHFLSAIANGQGDLDWSSLALVVARDAGLKENI